MGIYKRLGESVTETPKKISSKPPQKTVVSDQRQKKIGNKTQSTSEEKDDEKTEKNAL